MAEDKPEDSEPLSERVRAKRSPPTIDLEPGEVSSETSSQTRDQAEPGEAGANPRRSSPWIRQPALSSAVISAVTGGCVAALVIAAAWLSGWPGDAAPSSAPSSPPPVSSAAIDDLAARMAAVESRTSKPAPSADPAMAARVDGLEKSVAALRAQSDQLAANLKEIKSANDSGTAPDIAAINQRIEALERATRAQNAELAEQKQEQQKAEENTKPADDVPLRRIVAASLLDVLVRIGDPYPAALAAAKSLASNPGALKPLEAFATSGVPSSAVLSRELLALVPKLSPPSAENAGTGSSLVDRLQAGAAKLVRIERTDIQGNERGNVVARVTAAALRNDYNEARRELNTLPPAERAPAQGWIEKADARDAALAVSRRFAAEAMTALAKPAP
jgi:hypothetical protein